MSDRRQLTPHPPEDQLLRLSDGELSAREAAATRSHLELCWQCRSRLDELEAGIADYMRYEEHVLKPLLPSPPRPWTDLGHRLEQLDAKAPGAAIFDAKAFAAMPEEIRLRLLLRAIDRFGHEGPAELGKVEAMLSVLGRAMTEPSSRRRPRLKQTLAGALVSLIDDRITVAPSPPRRRRSD